ncbi:hypothetical protein ADUPG1_007707 [Aduncisulcus paluster]|uniref:Uncharacterized protein n=1 Tax=Aduncisulcus paluster TaxID=2918883 RepID=A0ABQ5KP89_9EUKA|nr:hypothetical protein ADUPG1_007707 [Aduncisulcus paluster]
MIFPSSIGDSSSALTSDRALFTLCFECLSLFVQHECACMSSDFGDADHDENNDCSKLTLDESSLKKLIERSLRQSMYDLIERTGGGVEAMFDQGTYGTDEIGEEKKEEEEK